MMIASHLPAGVPIEPEAYTAPMMTDISTAEAEEHTHGGPHDRTPPDCRRSTTDTIHQKELRWQCNACLR
jgi:hypothetical protein